jgi:hypothetical protein
MLQERQGLEKYVTAQMYYSLVGRGLEYEFQSFAEYHNIGILVWSPLAGGFLAGKYSRANPAPAGTRFAEAGSFVPFDKEMGYRVVDALKDVAGPLIGRCRSAGPGATGMRSVRRKTADMDRDFPACRRLIPWGRLLVLLEDRADPRGRTTHTWVRSDDGH